MGRHPSRDEIASADYWGASVWVAVTGRGDEGVHVGWDWWLPLCLGSRGASKADRLFPQSALLQPPLTRRPARRQAGREAGKERCAEPKHKKNMSLQKNINSSFLSVQGEWWDKWRKMKMERKRRKLRWRHQKCKDRCQKLDFSSCIFVGVEEKID